MQKIDEWLIEHCFQPFCDKVQAKKTEWDCFWLATLAIYIFVAGLTPTVVMLVSYGDVPVAILLIFAMGAMVVLGRDRSLLLRVIVRPGMVNPLRESEVYIAFRVFILLFLIGGLYWLYFLSPEGIELHRRVAQATYAVSLCAAVAWSYFNACTPKRE